MINNPTTKYALCFLGSCFWLIVMCGESHASDKSVSYLGVKYQMYDVYGVDLFGKSPVRGLSMGPMNYPILDTTPRDLKRDVKIDSTGQYITFSESMFNIPFTVPARYSLEQYLMYSRPVYRDLLWQEYKVRHLMDDLPGQKSHSGLEIDIPVKIKSKAFQTIFGGDRVGLTVNGAITINGGFRHEDRSEVRTALTRGSNNNFRMEQTQQFKVTGNIGDKVKVSVDQDSERPFDFENTMKLNYTGYEDEIIKSIEAGNISLSLPATRFVSFSGKNSGLFGLKAEAAMGNLNLTMIASQEKGENKKLSYDGGSQSNTNTIKDYNYLKGYYFFLDSLYMDQYFPLNAQGEHTYASEDQVIDEIEVYVTTSENDPDGIQGYAAADKNKIFEDTFEPTEEHKEAYWKRLEFSTEYELQPDLGYIRLKQPVLDGKMLAVAYKDKGGRTVGEIDYEAVTDSTKKTSKPIHLRMLKPELPKPSDRTWWLMFRHVYSLGAKEISPDGFELKINLEPPSGDPQETIEMNGKVQSYLELFGLDKYDVNGSPNPDNIIDNNPNILRLNEGELHLPSLYPFKDSDILPPDKFSAAMYDTTGQKVISDSKFVIEVKSSSRSATINLGWNVIEESEEVRLNGRSLTKGTDYIIDYYSGTLTILDETATSPSANLEVNYQRNELFQLDKKTLLGLRADYNLWDNSFIGGTFLYLNQRTLDTKVRVGKAPMRNMIWDVNSKLVFNPNFLTIAIDALPIIQTKQPSALTFEGEIAQILPNPNTLNNDATGDPDGVAYIDDFEASKKITPLGVTQWGWTPASPPVEKFSRQEDLERRVANNNFYWYNDYNMTPIHDIWPNRQIAGGQSNRTHVLDFILGPTDEHNTDSNISPEDYWAGVMRSLSGGYADQSESKFLEIWVNGNAGTVHIDLGQISEDVIPNGLLDTEDLIPEGGGYRNKLLDDGEDVGLDGMAGKDSDDYWDVNRNGVKDVWEPYSYDDWAYDPNGSGSYKKSNGTEDNRNSTGGTYPDTEDIDGNGSLDRVNNYFSYAFSLDKNSPDAELISGENVSKGWYQYRIPLNAFRYKEGEPDMQRLKFARIWFDGFPLKDKAYNIRIAEINIVGNDWKEQKLARGDWEPYDIENDSTVVAAVINTHDNPDYQAPRGVRGEVDRVYDIESKEQSLVIKMDQLPQGYNGILLKTFFQAENYMNYEKLKMYVHGGNSGLTNFYAVEDKQKPNIEVFLRLGANENNYYEIRQPVYADWDGNDFEIDLAKLTALKTEKSRQITHDDGIKEIPKKFTNANGDTITWRVVGDPSLTNIKQLVLGVKNIGISPFSGEIWANELRLSGVRKDKGIAMRARVDLAVADVFSVNAEVNKQDADFHNVNEQFGRGDNQYSNTLGAKLELSKFLPRSWGLSIPISGNYKTSRSTPKYLPGSDILITGDTPQALVDSATSKSDQTGLNVSFGKSTKSNNFFIRNTLDALSMSFSSSQSNASDSRTAESTKETYAGTISYSLRFNNATSNVRLFSWTKPLPIVGRMSDVKFSYLPTNLSLKASGNRSKNYTLTRSGLASSSNPFTISRSVQSGYKPFDIISFDASRDYKSDLTAYERPLDELKNGRFGTLTNITQSAKGTFNPRLSSWLTSNFSYTTNYNWSNNLQQASAGTGRSASDNTSTSATFTFDPAKLVQSFSRSGSPTRRGANTPTRSPRDRRANLQAQEQNKKQEEEKKSSPNPFKRVMSGIGVVTSNMQAISINYTESNNYSYNGLKEGMPSWRFALGLEDSTGLGIVDNLGSNTGSARSSTSWKVSSGVKVGRNISVSLRFNQDESDNQNSNQRTGDFSQSTFKLSKDAAPIPFPEWSVSWAGLEKIPLFSKLVDRLKLDHAFSGKTSSSWQNAPDNKIRESYNASFRPLLGFTVTWKKDISTNIRYNNTFELEDNFGSGGGTRKNSSDFSLSGSYQRSGGFRVPLPIWPFKNKEFKNSMNMSVTMSMSNNVNEQNKSGGEWQEMDRSSKWSFKPEIRYNFSTNVSGGMHFEYGKNDSKRAGTTKFTEFGLNVRIEIKGS
ncbi:cell surface protein SprA [candidate division KSB1 bacterium]|nr:cell surface protein SprA [candidate division KSB1 bacterium]